MRKLLKVLFLVGLCTTLFVACKGKNKTKTTVPTVKNPEVNEEIEVEKDAYKFGYSCITMGNPYFIELESMLRTQIEAKGYTLTTKDAKSDIELQKKQIDEFIEEGIDVLFLSPVDWQEITPALEKLNEAGIKIVNLDTKVQNTKLIHAYVGSRNKTAGKLCGQDLLQRVPDGGKIIIVECPNRSSINERIQGFEKSIAKKGFEVVARIDAKGDLEVALPEVEMALQQYPDVVAIMCGNDPSALGAVIAANSVGATNVIIYGIDGSPEVKKELTKENSLIVATAAQSTSVMAETAVDIAMKVLNEEEFEKTTYIDTFLITKENIGDYDINSWQ